MTLSCNAFSGDYLTAKKRFRQAAASAGATISDIPLTASPDTRGLTTDIAWIGPPAPQKALIVVSGIHGVEGFAGAAIQLAALQRLPSLRDDTAIIMVHALNPYGMANLRRFNQNNVDLNRNFHFSAGSWEGEPKGYALLNSFLNPQREPKRDFFYLRLLMAQLSLGEEVIRQAVAEGQYRYPEGLFYGGRHLEPEAENYIDWLKESSLLQIRQLMVLDIHTGLGRFGEQSLFLRSDSITKEQLSQRLGLEIVPDQEESRIMGYDHGGGSSGAYHQLFTGKELVCLTVEYGTYSGRRLLYALRAENQHQHFGDGSVTHWSKQKLLEAFCPRTETWRKSVLKNGVDLILKSLQSLNIGTGASS